MGPLLPTLVMLALPSGALVLESSTQSDVRFFPVDGGPPIRIAPDGGAGYGRRQGSAHILTVDPSTGGVLLGWRSYRGSAETTDLFYVNADGRHAERPKHLLDDLAPVGRPVFSPDGRFVLAATSREVVEFDIDHGTSVVRGRIPAPLPERQLPTFLELDWSTATPAIELAETGAGLRWRALDRTLANVALLDQPPIPKPTVVPGVPRWRAIPGTLDLVTDTEAEPRTIHHRFADGTIGLRVGILEQKSPIRGVTPVPGSNTLTWYRGRTLLARDYGRDTGSPERTLLVDVGDAMTRTVTAGPRPCVILGRTPPLSLLAVPVDGGPPIDLPAQASDGVGFGVAGGFVLYAARTRHRLLVSSERGPARPVSPPLPGGVLFDAWSPDRAHYVWQTTSNDPNGNDVWSYAVGAQEARQLATGGAGIGGFAGDWLLIDRSPETAPDMVRLDQGGGSLRPSKLPAGIVSMAGRASPPAWLGLSKGGDLWMAAVDAAGPSDAVRLATGLDPFLPLAIWGTRAIVRRASEAGGGLVSVETEGPETGGLTPLPPELVGADVTRYGEPVGRRLFVRAQHPDRVPPVEWLAIPLDGRGSAALSELGVPEADFLTERDAITPATNEAGDAGLLSDATGVWLWREGRSAVRLAANLPGPSPDPMSPERPDTRQPRVLGWPSLGPTGLALLVRGPEMLLADTRLPNPTLRAVTIPSDAPRGLLEQGHYMWVPDGGTLAGTDGRTMALIDAETATIRLLPLGADVVAAYVQGAAPDGDAFVVWVATRYESRLLSVPVRGSGPVHVLVASADRSLTLVDFFGRGSDWTRRRAPTLRSGVGLTWYSTRWAR